MTALIETRFGDLGEIFDGPHATPARVQVGPYFLNIASLQSGRLVLEASDHVSEGDFARWTRRVTPQEDDLLFSYETRLGEAALMPRGVVGCLGRRMALLRPNRELVDPRFLLFFYLSPTFQRLIAANTVHGATVPRIPLKTMGEWPIAIPALAEQRAIAEVLGALDDKIAANERVEKAASDYAASLFRRRMEGVEYVRMSDVLVPFLGGTPRRADDELWAGGTHPWVSVKDISAAQSGVVVSTSEQITDKALANKRTSLRPAGTVLLSARGTVGTVARLGMPAAVNQSCYAFSSDAIPAGCLFYVIADVAGQLKKMAHGSVFDTVTMATFDHVEVPDLPWGDWVELEHQIGPGMDAIVASVKESRTLAATRDALLPLLLSGKLRVKDAERQVEEVL